MTAEGAERLRRGDPLALARALTLVENDSAAAAALLADLTGAVGRAHRVGITGPPGAGKSTLLSALVSGWRRDGRRVGVLAVDPSSPLTGGALLGDRIRMAAHQGDDGVFIRSMASRGAWGGLSVAAQDAADLLDAAGFDPVVLETVGVGQGEVEVARAADTTVVVVAPGSGDDVQGMKAGLLEVADLVVVNQSDREGADRFAERLEAALSLASRAAPPVLRTVATTGRGVDALRARIDERGAPAAHQARQAKRLDRARARIRAEVDRRRACAFWERAGSRLEGLAAEVAAGRMSVAAASAALAGEGAP